MKACNATAVTGFSGFGGPKWADAEDQSLATFLALAAFLGGAAFFEVAFLAAAVFFRGAFLGAAAFFEVAFWGRAAFGVSVGVSRGGLRRPVRAMANTSLR